MMREPMMHHLKEKEFLAPLRVDDIDLSWETRRITRSGRIIHVSPIEFRLLERLMEKQGRILSRTQLLEMVWGSTGIDVRTVDTHISQLRKVLSADGETDPIKTARGCGYCLLKTSPRRTEST
jgi:two-component system, OmpR family, phosphate regulon response regulator PhoB